MLSVVGDVGLVIVGILAVFVVLDAALRTFVLPRGAPVYFTHVVFRTVRRSLEVVARPNRSYEWRDRVMALYAPLALLMFPAVALLTIFLAYTCFFEAFESRGWHDALL